MNTENYFSINLKQNKYVRKSIPGKTSDLCLADF